MDKYNTAMSAAFAALYGPQDARRPQAAGKRRLLKNMTFCACYGGDPASVARRAGLSPAEVQAKLDQWKQRYPEIAHALSPR